jgi:exopolysaccharide production protein ExoZ
MTMRQQGKFVGLEIGRGIAALLVVIHHASRIAAEPRYFGQTVWGGVAEFFYVGVDFFFVLSGFIIAHVHLRDLGDRSALPRFAAKRFLRIYPPYWGVLLPLLFAYLLLPETGRLFDRELGTVVSSVLLLPHPGPLVLGVAWTLVHEMLFYLIFGILIWAGRGWLWLLALWAVLILGWHLSGASHWLIGFVLNPFNLEFVMGVGVALGCARWTLPGPRVIAALGAVVFIGAMVAAPAIHADALIARLVFGVSAAAIIAGLVGAGGVSAAPRWIWAFGASSYAVYLVHPPVLALAARLGREAGLLALPAQLGLVVLTVTGFAAGVMYWSVIEPRLTRLFSTPLRGWLAQPAMRP